ncbi:YhgE/Pip family protein [Lacticaseibacillus camelliae]|uniref:YhgE/Pip family protein n=1 Tax=Lacticaseibacillus camelliae TaxID=381742 RepID=UPI000704F557|nr:YhgE/Pip domain-containing protein [Lacticaseibacillus camelliae]
MLSVKKHARFITLIGLVVAIPLLLLFIALHFVNYEQANTTRHIKVAVVDQDQPAKFQGVAVHAGRDVTQKLRENHDVDWQFVSAKTARSGLAKGTYLMAVTLPQDFSANVTTALSPAPKHSTLKVALSPHNNFASHLINTTVVTKLQSQVVQNVQQAYDGAALTALNSLGDGVSQAHAATAQLADGSGQVQDGLVQLTANNQKLTSGATQVQGAIGKLVAGNAQLLAGNRQVTSGATTLANSLQQAAAEIQQQLSAGAPDLARLDQALTTLTNGVNALAAGVNAPAMVTLNTNISTNAKKLGTDASAMQSALVAMNGQLFDKTNSKSTAAQLASAGANFTTAGDTLKQLQSQLMKEPAVLALAAKNPALLQELLTIQKTMTAGGAALQGAGDSLAQGGASATKLKVALTDTGATLPKLGNDLTTLSGKMTDLKNGVNQLANKKQGAPALAVGVRQAIGTLQGGLKTVQAGLTRTGNTPSTMGAVQGAGQLANGSGQVQSGLDQVHSGLQQVYTGLAGTAQNPGLIAGLTQYTDGTAKLADGNQQVADGMSKLNVKLGSGAGQVVNLSTGKANVAQFVTPVATQTASDPLAMPLANVLAPLVLLMVSFIASLLTELGFGRYSKSFAAQKLITRIGVVGLTVALQAVGIALVATGLGVSITHPFTLFLTLLSSGAIFTMIIFAFDRFLGTLGVLATLAILFVQLIVSGGLLPNAMLSGFYQVVAHLVPGTYLIDLLNQSLNGLQTGSVLDVLALVLFAVLFGALLWAPRHAKTPSDVVE